MIILGFRGIGKTALAATNPKYIDLNSSLFWIASYKVRKGDYDWGRTRWSNWERVAGNIAEALSSQGHVVFCDIDSELMYRLEDSKEEIVLIYPSLALKDEWIKKLEEANYGKNAIESLKNNYENAIKCLMDDKKFKHFEITTMMYDLITIIDELENSNNNETEVSNNNE